MLVQLPDELHDVQVEQWQCGSCNGICLWPSWEPSVPSFCPHCGHSKTTPPADYIEQLKAGLQKANDNLPSY